MLELVLRRYRYAVALPLLDSLRDAIHRYQRLCSQEPTPLSLSCEVEEEQLLADPQALSERPDFAQAHCSLIGDLPIWAEGKAPPHHTWTPLPHPYPFPSQPLERTLELKVEFPTQYPFLAGVILYALAHGTQFLYPFAGSPPWPCEIAYPHLQDKKTEAHVSILKNGLIWRKLSRVGNLHFMGRALQALIAESLNLALDAAQETPSRSEEALFLRLFPILDQRIQDLVPSARPQWETATWNSVMEPRWDHYLEQIGTREEITQYLRTQIVQYAERGMREAELTIELFRASYLPALESRRQEWVHAIASLRSVGEGAPDAELKQLHLMTQALGQACQEIDHLEHLLQEMRTLNGEALAQSSLSLLIPKRETVSQALGALSGWIEENNWPLPKVRLWRAS